MTDHGPVLPIVLPLATGALAMLTGTRWPRATAVASVLSALAALALAIGLFGDAADDRVRVVLLGNWAAPWGIALALDRLSALMLLLTAVVGCASLLFALGGDAGRGRHFHALFHFQWMGLNGAFLTADLFNLFVFFEVLLAASYALLLHGDATGRRARLRASVHYVVFNLVGSALFLVGLALLYAATGTLNMADVAQRLATLSPAAWPLAQAAAGLLLTVFAVKAALLPLYFWLPETYASATAPVAALFAILTKVGVYAIVRVSTLAFVAPVTADVASPALPVLALATLALAGLGVVAATRLRRLAAYLVVASAGTLLLAAGLGTPQAMAAGLFYLVDSTLVAACTFLLADRIAAARGGHDGLARHTMTGRVPVLAAGFFVLAIAAASVPPLAGFLAKSMLLQAALDTPLGGWSLAVLLGSSLATLLALARAGSSLFWASSAAGPRPAVAVPASHAGAPAKGLAIVALCGAIVALAIFAGPVSAWCTATAAQLGARTPYLSAVLGAKPVPAAYDVRREMRERGDAK